MNFIFLDTYFKYHITKTRKSNLSGFLLKKIRFYQNVVINEDFRFDSFVGEIFTKCKY